MDKIETITSGNRILAYIIRAKHSVKKTAFFTPPTANLQVGYVVYPAKTAIKRHIHKTIHRKLDRTEEVLVVRKGKCVIDIYDEKKKPVVSKKLSEGDIIVLVDGGHGFKVLEDIILLEVKQGPYTGIEEKERF